MYTLAESASTVTGRPPARTLIRSLWKFAHQADRVYIAYTVCIRPAETVAKTVSLQSHSWSQDTVSCSDFHSIAHAQYANSASKTGGKLGKCECHADPSKPIRDATRAPADIAESFEVDREHAKELRKLRQSRSGPSSEAVPKASKRTHTAASSDESGQADDINQALRPLTSQ